MSDAPRYDTRRQQQLFEELLARARTWLPEWQPESGDFGRALLQIVARVESEVTQRLDRIGEKNFRGFLHWLGVRGGPARAARLPIVLTLSSKARPVLASQPVRVQAQEVEPPVVFETLTDLLVVPARPTALVAADTASDAFFLPPPGLFSLVPPPAEPTEWRTRSLAGVDSKILQLDPALGLKPQIILAIDGEEYRVTEAKQGIVRIEPPLSSEVAENTRVNLVSAFDAYGAATRNRQEHSLFIGDDDLLNLEGSASIQVITGAELGAQLQWSYWGKVGEELTWVPFDSASFDADSGAYVLQKSTPGAIEKLDLGGRNSRYLRAQVQGDLVSPVLVSKLQLRLNFNAGFCGMQFNPQSLPPPVGNLSGLANTTPLVLDGQFYPLGIEPRQFDAFFLSSPEAFSKANALALLDFSLAEPTLGPMAATRLFAGAAFIQYAVGKDRQLHRVQVSTTGLVSFLKPVRPPLNDVASAAAGQEPIPVDRDLLARPAATSSSFAVRVAIAAQRQVWVWRQSLFGNSWQELGAPFEAPLAMEPLQIVMLEAPFQTYVFALQDGKLRYRALSAPAWQDVEPQIEPAEPLEIARIVPILTRLNPLAGGAVTRGLLAVTADGNVHRLSADGAPAHELSFDWLRIDILKDPGDSDSQQLDADIAPLALESGAGNLIIIGRQQLEPEMTGPERLIAFRAGPQPRFASIAITGVLQPGGFDFLDVDADEVFVVLFAAKRDAADNGYLGRWVAFDTGINDVVFEGTALSDEGVINGPPSVLERSGPSGKVIFPAEDNAVLLTEISHEEITGTEQVPLLQLLTVEADFTLASHVLVTGDADPVVSELQFIADLSDGRKLLGAEDLTPVGSGFEPQIHRVSEEFTGKRDSSATGGDANCILVLDLNDAVTVTDSLLLIQLPGGRVAVKVKEVKGVEEVDSGEERKALLVKALPAGGDPNAIKYRVLTRPMDADLVPALQAANATQAEVLRRAVQLYFKYADPTTQFLLPPVMSMPLLLLLNEQWIDPPPCPDDDVEALLDDVQGEWEVYRPQARPNPELSWEYWDGRSWLKIRGLIDRTANFLRSGQITFCVPADLQPTEVAGRTGHWIRARLVGGDYGQADFVVTTTPAGSGSTQRIDRNVDAVRAPLVLMLAVHYAICCGSTPRQVATLNNGSLIDQSDANRTTGASVAVFLPLSSVTEQTLLAAQANAEQESCCQRPTAPPLNDHSSIPADCEGGTPAAASNQAEATAARRALYLGLDKEISGGPITLLFLVEERQLDTAFPLVVEVLRRGRFERILVEDGTRGLSESGIVTLTIPQAPTLTQLFGQDRFWLRLRPNERSDVADWEPKIRGVFLNAAWAIAAETQLRERLGSSDGSPNQRVVLARPPVIDGSLELRIREPLSEEDITALRATNPNAVKLELDGVAGPWVLWREVIDPQDSLPGERVYSLDDERGVIQFGDGLHGAIPPTGRDAILAERYQHTSDARANGVVAWSPVSPVTPVAGLESVIVPESAAGGADADSVAATLRAAPAVLRHRNRAVTLRDLEQMAQQSSPQIVQARAVQASGAVRLIAVGRAPDVQPKSAQLRALRQFLLERTSPLLAADGRLQVVAPELIQLRLNVRLLVTELESTGRLQQAVSAALRAFFDAASGGSDGTGWPLGAVPTVTDVAAVLVDLADSAGLDTVEFARRLPNDDVVALPARLRPDQLIVLAPADIEIRFAIDNAEVQA